MKLKFVIILMLTTGFVCGQNKGDWYKKNLEDNVYGIELAKAQDFLKSKTVKKAPVVALLTTGIDFEHEMIVKSLWVNKKEKEDGKDNNKNGYIDDINGWNFLGSRNGEDMMEHTTTQDDREWLRLSDKYAGILFNGKDYIMYVDGVKTIVPKPQNMKEYAYFCSMKSQIGQKYNGYTSSLFMKDFVKEWDGEFSKRMAGKTRQEMQIPECISIIQDIIKKKTVLDSIEVTSLAFLRAYTGFRQKEIEANTFMWKDVYEHMTTAQIPYSKKLYDDYLAKSCNDNRNEIVGDNHLDFNDRYYGNNLLLTPQAMLGTATAGILVNICPNVKIMPIVAFTEQGDPYLKDIANAIYYAVDNGADVIVSYAQSYIYPEDQRKKVADAIKYAEKKGVLIVVPTLEYADDMNKRAYYPSDNMDERFKLNNMLVVANSDSLGLPAMTSNYGANQLNIYAPGINIYTSTPGDLYRESTNAFFGATMVAGVSALIKSYVPSLTGKQIREIILNNPTSRRGVEVEKSIIIKNKIVQDVFLFEQLCSSAGILNVNKAVRAALNIK